MSINSITKLIEEKRKSQRERTKHITMLFKKNWFILFGSSSLPLEVIQLTSRLLYASDKASTKIGQPKLFLQI